MRLIDKDDLLELIKDLEVTYQEDLDRFKNEELANPQRYRDTQRGRIEGVIDCYIDVYNAEEIKAIPIDWITKYLHELNKQAEEELDFIINELGGYDTCHMMGYVIGIEKMLEKWEKENDK